MLDAFNSGLWPLSIGVITLDFKCEMLYYKVKIDAIHTSSISWWANNRWFLGLDNQTGFWNCAIFNHHWQLVAYIPKFGVSKNADYLVELMQHVPRFWSGILQSWNEDQEKHKHQGMQKCQQWMELSNKWSSAKPFKSLKKLKDNSCKTLSAFSVHDILEYLK